MKNEFNFQKVQGTWFIDLPSYPGDLADLAMVLGADKMLDQLSNNHNSVTLSISDGWFDGSFVLTKDVDLKLIPDELKETANEMGGAFYIYDESMSVWLCDVTKFVFATDTMPDQIYFKVVDSAEWA